MNESFFKNIHISNFKSLKDLTLSDCKRINVLIGKPNVGKSNILEAIGLLGLNESFKLNDFIRVSSFAELFFEGNRKEAINVESDAYFFKVELEKDTSNFSQELSGRSGKKGGAWTSGSYVTINNEFEISFSKNDSNVKQYKFIPSFAYHTQNITDLIPPFGGNLFNIIQMLPDLQKNVSKIFSEYRLKLVFDKTSDSLKVMKELNGGAVFLLPYNSIADTLQRVIFYKAAIASNENSILLFEEPEAHCFPPYIAHFTQEVINSETNQFFIATHSPYVLNDFLEYNRDDVAIYMADFKDGQTVIYRLTDDEVNEVYNDGIDVFFNYERYTQHG